MCAFFVNVMACFFVYVLGMLVYVVDMCSVCYWYVVCMFVYV